MIVPGFFVHAKGEVLTFIAYPGLMKFLPRFTILALLTAAFLAYSAAPAPPDGEKPQKVKVKNYSVVIPGHMVATTELNDEASLQYQNIYKELYILVIDEPKDEVINAFTEAGEYDTTKSPVTNYRTFLIRLLQESLSVKGGIELTKDTINGLSAEIATFHATAPEVGAEVEVFYQAAFYEGKNNFYYLTTWTLTEMEEKNRKEMKEMIYSFKASE